MANEKIEVGYRHIGTFAGVDYHHKFLLYTDKTGGQYTNQWMDRRRNYTSTSARKNSYQDRIT